MELLLKEAYIVHPQSKHHQTRKDLLVVNGTIREIKSKLSVSSARLIQSKDLHCSPGWVDIGTHLGEPGYEYRETTDSLCRAASAGGYTTLIPFPSTDPIIQTASDIQYIKHQFEPKLQDVFPIAALSKDRDGKDLTEMNDLIAHGSIGFSDGLTGNTPEHLLLRAMQYVKHVPALVIFFPYNTTLANEGQIHEGKTSVMLGLPGIPELAEIIPLKSALEIAAYVESPLLIHCLSSKDAVDVLKRLPKKNRIFASVSYLNLIASDEELMDFDVNYKVLPPLRDEAARKSLLNQVLKGNIQAIVSNHRPLEEEKKMLEFPYATPGATGLETMYAALNTFLGKDPVNALVPAFSIGPRQIFGIPIPSIEKEKKANLTFFDPSISWTYDNPLSLSHNNPFIGKEFTGKVLGVVNGRKLSMTV